MHDSQPPDVRARELLSRVLPDAQWTEFAKTDSFEVSGSRGIYQMSSGGTTRVLDLRTRQLRATACLQLTVPAPAADRLIAEYLLVANDENLYWRTANVFPTSIDNRSFALFMLLVLDLFLFAVLMARLIH